MDDRDDDRRAWHLSEAVLGADEPTAAAMERVAQRAADRAAYAVAASGAERAAALSPAVPDQARRLLAAGTWAWLGGSTDDARHRWRRVAEITRSPTIRARARHLLGVIAARSGSVEQARDILLRAAAEATESTDALASLAEAVDVCFLLGDAATAVTVAREIESLLPEADDRRPGPRVDRCRLRPDPRRRRRPAARSRTASTGCGRPPSATANPPWPAGR